MCSLGLLAHHFSRSRQQTHVATNSTVSRNTFRQDA